MPSASVVKELNCTKCDKPLVKNGRVKCPRCKQKIEIPTSLPEGKWFCPECLARGEKPHVLAINGQIKCRWCDEDKNFLIQKEEAMTTGRVAKILDMVKYLTSDENKEVISALPAIAALKELESQIVNKEIYSSVGAGENICDYKILHSSSLKCEFDEWGLTLGLAPTEYQQAYVKRGIFNFEEFEIWEVRIESENEERMVRLMKLLCDPTRNGVSLSTWGKRIVTFSTKTADGWEAEFDAQKIFAKILDARRSCRRYRKGWGWRLRNKGITISTYWHEPFIATGLVDGKLKIIGLRGVTLTEDIIDFEERRKSDGFGILKATPDPSCGARSIIESFTPSNDLQKLLNYLGLSS